MGLVIQFQRRAIEAVYTPIDLSLNRHEKYYFGRRQLYFLGISPGIGTCSDLQGINIAVFGYTYPGELSPKINSCQGAVLLRNPRFSETQEFYKGTALMAVEGLALTRRTEQRVILQSNGKSKAYVTI